MAILCALVVAVAAAQAGCKCTPNPYTPKPLNATFIRSSTNGKLYMDYGVNPPIRIVHVWGTPYEMGFATGSLLSAELKSFLPKVMDYFETSAGDSFPKDTPTWLLNLIEKHGVVGRLSVAQPA